MKYLDMITVAVPPALVACLAIAVAAAVARLWRQRISVSSSGHVTLAGLVDTVAFDKTGTLTENGLELRELRVAEGGRFRDKLGGGGAGGGRMDGVTGGCGDAAAPHHVGVLLAACHGLAVVDGQVVGDPLEVKLFEASGWRCVGDDGWGDAAGQCERLTLQAASEAVVGKGGAATATVTHESSGAGGAGGDGTVFEAPGGAQRCRVVWRLDFTSARQRSSVVVEGADGGLTVYAKVWVLGWG